MPWMVQKDSRCPSYKPWGVVNQQNHNLEGCHVSKESGTQQQKALYANVPKSKEGLMSSCGCSPRDRAARARSVARQLRLRSGTVSALTAAVRLDRWAGRQDDADGDWDDDAGHLVQAVDQVLDEALEAFQAGHTNEGTDLVVAAAATIDQCLEAMGLPDSDEQGQGPAGGMSGMASAIQDDEGQPQHVIGLRAVDESAWDGPAAMSNCAKSDTPASCYGSICAGRKAGDTSTQDAWALPHHKTPGGPPNRAGVRNALSRLPQTQGLTNKAAAQAHLNAHLAAMGGSKSAEPDEHDQQLPHPTGSYRGVLPFEVREEVREDGQVSGMPTLAGHFAVFNQWTEIHSFWEGDFLERVDPQAFTRSMREERDQMRVLFQHGRDPQIGSKPLGPIRKLEANQDGAYYEVPLLDTGYNRDLLPGLREGLYGASFRFETLKDQWDEHPSKSDYNPRGLPERTLLDVSVAEFGPVTFPAYTGATAGLRSLTDEFYPPHTHEFAGRPDPWRAGGGDSDERPEPGAPARQSSSASSARERALRLRGI